MIYAVVDPDCEYYAHIFRALSMASTLLIIKVMVLKELSTIAEIAKDIGVSEGWVEERMKQLLSIGIVYAADKHDLKVNRFILPDSLLYRLFH